MKKIEYEKKIICMRKIAKELENSKILRGDELELIIDYFYDINILNDNNYTIDVYIGKLMEILPDTNIKLINLCASHINIK